VKSLDVEMLREEEDRNKSVRVRQTREHDDVCSCRGDLHIFKRGRSDWRGFHVRAAFTCRVPREAAPTLAAANATGDPKSTDSIESTVRTRGIGNPNG
jgi:hypothetical protein